MIDRFNIYLGNHELHKEVYFNITASSYPVGIGQR